MYKDVLGYVTMAVLGAAAVILMVAGVVKHNFETSLIGMIVGIYATVIGTSTSNSRAFKKQISQIEDQIKNLQK
jgi:hypothetical protein